MSREAGIQISPVCIRRRSDVKIGRPFADVILTSLRGRCVVFSCTLKMHILKKIVIIQGYVIPTRLPKLNFVATYHTTIFLSKCNIILRPYLNVTLLSKFDKIYDVTKALCRYQMPCHCNVALVCQSNIVMLFGCSVAAMLSAECCGMHSFDLIASFFTIHF